MPSNAYNYFRTLTPVCREIRHSWSGSLGATTSLLNAMGSTGFLIWVVVWILKINQVVLSSSSTQVNGVLSSEGNVTLQTEPNFNLTEEKRENDVTLSDIILGYDLIVEITKVSNFPIVFASNISEKCFNDSLDFLAADSLLTVWANKSMFKLVIFINSFI